MASESAGRGGSSGAARATLTFQDLEGLEVGLGFVLGLGLGLDSMGLGLDLDSMGFVLGLDSMGLDWTDWTDSMGLKDSLGLGLDGSLNLEYMDSKRSELDVSSSLAFGGSTRLTREDPLGFDFNGSLGVRMDG